MIATSFVPSSTIPLAVRSSVPRFTSPSLIVLSEKLFPVTVIRPLAGPIRSALAFTIVNVLAESPRTHARPANQCPPPDSCAITFADSVIP